MTVPITVPVTAKLDITGMRWLDRAAAICLLSLALAACSRDLSA